MWAADRFLRESDPARFRTTVCLGRERVPHRITAAGVEPPCLLPREHRTIFGKFVMPIEKYERALRGGQSAGHSTSAAIFVGILRAQ